MRGGPLRLRFAIPIGLHHALSSQPLRYSRRMYWSASGQFVARSFRASHSIFLPTRSATLPSSTNSVSRPA